MMSLFTATILAALFSAAVCFTLPPAGEAFGSAAAALRANALRDGASGHQGPPTMADRVTVGNRHGAGEIPAAGG